MPESPPGNDPGSPSESDDSASENSDSSSSDFEIQAITTADGIRTEKTTEETKASDENQQQLDESEAVDAPDAVANENHSNALGLSAYSDSSSDSEQAPHPSPKSALTPVSKRRGGPKKQVRFADDPPEKRQRVEDANGPRNGPVNGHLVANGDDEDDEGTVLAQLAAFEAAVADAGRDTDDIEADLVDADDAREEAEQHALEDSVKRLREAVMRRRAQAKSGGSIDLLDESSEEDSDEEAEVFGKVGTR